MKWTDDLHNLLPCEENYLKICKTLAEVMEATQKGIKVDRRFYEFGERVAPQLISIAQNSNYPQTINKYSFYTILNLFLSVDEVLYEDGMYLIISGVTYRLRNKYDCMIISNLLYRTNCKKVDSHMEVY